jgi:hypothetical protein
MAVKIYESGNYFFIDSPDAGIVSDHKSRVNVYLDFDGEYKFESPKIGFQSHPLSDLVDSTGTPFTLLLWDAFYRLNTGFNTASGGSGATVGWKGEVEYYADLPISLSIPLIGDTYLVEQPTKIGIGILSYTTKQSGLWIKDFDTGSLSDWRKLNVKVKFLDSEFSVVSAADESAKAKFDMSLVSGSSVRSLKVQNKDGTIALLSDLERLSLTADAFPTFDTAVALSDLNLIITDLEALPVTSAISGTITTSTMTPGVYTISGAATINGTLTLDGTGVANAVFVIRGDAGISLGASANIALINTLPENVHFIAQGAFPLGAGATMNGNMISKAGSPTAGAGCTVVGRMLTLNGVVSADTSNLSLPSGVSFNINYRSCIDMVMFTGVGAATNAGVSVYNGNVATNLGAITGFGTATVNGTEYPVGISIVNQNNYLPVDSVGGTIFVNSKVVHLSPPTNVLITGFDSTGFVENQEFTIINSGVGEVTLEALSPDSDNNNKISANAAVVIKQYQSKDLIFVTTPSSKFQVKGN